MGMQTGTMPPRFRNVSDRPGDYHEADGDEVVSSVDQLTNMPQTVNQYLMEYNRKLGEIINAVRNLHGTSKVAVIGDSEGGPVLLRIESGEQAIGFGFLDNQK